MVYLEIALVLLLIVVNGFLALSELSVVSARRARLQAMARTGNRRAEAALSLAEQPGRFLSTVQIGITLVGVLAGAFSGAKIAGRLAEVLTPLGMSPAATNAVAFAAVVAVITYLTLIIGELVPKHLALRDAERSASVIARPMILLSKVASPAVYVLDASTRIVLRLLGSKEESEKAVTDEEIKALIAEAESAGVVEPEERRMIAGVMRLGDRPVRAVMTPRHDIDWIDLNDDEATIRREIRESQHTRFPAARGDADEAIGVILGKDLLDAYLDGKPVDPRAFVRETPAVPDTMDALQVLELLKKSPIGIALVVDEYGHCEGLVTASDILETIVGSFRDVEEPHQQNAVRRQDGSWLLEGSMPADEMAELLNLTFGEDRDYHTVAGFMLYGLQHLPRTGETFDRYGWRFEVVDMDGKRVDKVLATRLPTRRAA